jgi:predicted methyltransferase
MAFFTFSGSLSAADFDSEKMSAVLAAQEEESQARYPFRHPRETLEFFEVAPGTVVVEALPGGGWYSKILAAYLGPEGSLAGVDYSPDMFPLFGFFSAEQLKAKENWARDWVAGAADWGIEDGAAISAFVFGDLPEEMRGTADTVLFIRALHNLARFEPDGQYLTMAMQDTYDVLKPGGVVGVVQHHARPDMPDDWAAGQNGYLKYQLVVDHMEAAGFEFIGAIDINANERDQPSTEDKVWRLPPVLNTSRGDPELRAQMMSIGESNRMTLKFRKPE